MKTLNKILAIALSLSNLGLQFLDTAVASRAPKLVKKENKLCYSDIPDHCRQAMIDYFKESNPEFKDVGELTPVAFFNRPIQLADKRNVKILVVNAPGLFKEGKFERKVREITFDNIDKDSPNIVHALINMALDENLAIKEAGLVGAKNIKRITEDEEELKRRIGILGRNVKKIVDSNEYKPVVNEVCKFLNQTQPGFEMNVDTTKEIISASMISSELQLIELDKKIHSLMNKSVAEKVLDTSGKVILAGAAIAEGAVDGVVSAAVGGIGSLLFLMCIGIANPALGLVAIPTAVAGIAGTLSGLNNGVERFKEYNDSIEYDDKMHKLEAEKLNEEVNIAVNQMVHAEKIANYGNLLSSFFDELIRNPDELRKANVCILVVDDREDVMSAIESLTEKDLGKTSSYSIWNQYPNRGSFCSFRCLGGSSQKIAPLFGNYTGRRGRNIFDFYKQVLNRLADCIEDGDYEEMNSMNNFIKGRPSPKKLLTEKKDSEDEK